MKRSMTCPKCQHRKLWVVPLVELARHETVQLPPEDIAEYAALGHDVSTATTEENVAGLEAYVCAQCGYTETWAISLEHVAKKGTLVDGAAAGSLFRP